MISKSTQTAHAALELHMKQHAGQILTNGTRASSEFDRLYTRWIQCRWDDGHAWTRSVWAGRPEAA